MSQILSLHPSKHLKLKWPCLFLACLPCDRPLVLVFDSVFFMLMKKKHGKRKTKNVHKWKKCICERNNLTLNSISVQKKQQPLKLWKQLLPCHSLLTLGLHSNWKKLVAFIYPFSSKLNIMFVCFLRRRSGAKLMDENPIKNKPSLLPSFLGCSYKKRKRRGMLKITAIFRSAIYVRFCISLTENWNERPTLPRMSISIKVALFHVYLWH